MKPYSYFSRLLLVGGVLAGGLSLCAQSLQITTVAGYAGKGSSDGVGGGALFNGAQGVATDAAGNVYVADTGNNTVREISPSGVSTTLAGTAGVTGSADGTGAAASFNQPCGIAVDAASNVYVSDFGSSVIRKITPAGAVSTYAGTANVTGSVNNTGTNALFNHPMGLCLDGTTNLYVADYGNQLIRKITPARVVSTLAGQAGTFGTNNGTGTAAQFYNPEAVTASASGTVYVADTGNAAIRVITPAGAVSTLAGSPGSLGSADGTGTNGLFFQPAGIVLGGSTLYVSDYFNNTIRQVSTNGTVVTLAGLPGTTGSVDGATSSARFWAPQGLAVNAAGTVYIADTANSAIRAMTAAGVVTTFAGSPSAASVNGTAGSARFFAPQDMAVDNQTNVYIADTRNSVIRKITPAGVVSILAGTAGVFGSADGNNALFSAPQGIAVDSAGNVYVADTGNSTIRKINPSGTVSTLAGAAGNPGNYDGTGVNAQFAQPQAVAVDAAGTVYVADTGNHTIRVITPGGVTTTLAGQAGNPGTFDGTNAQARFNAPGGIAVDGSGNLYVTDGNNHTIRQVTPAGVVTTIAGWAGVWGSSDGAGTNALFFNPAGISRDNAGNLYIVDSGNSTLRKLTWSGGLWTSSTVAGLAGNLGSADGTGNAAQFFYPGGVAVSPLGYVYVADTGNNTIRSQAIAPSLLTQPLSQTNLVGSIATFTVSVYGSTPLTYTWKYNGSNYAPGSSPTLLASNAGTYQVLVSNLAGSQLSAPAILTLTNGGSGSAGVFQSIALLNTSTVQFNLSGTAGAPYTLQVSTNLATWQPFISFTMTNGAVQLTDTNAASYKARFYKLSSP